MRGRGVSTRFRMIYKGGEGRELFSLSRDSYLQSSRNKSIPFNPAFFILNTLKILKNEAFLPAVYFINI
jgi:hypothetical protein